MTELNAVPAGVTVRSFQPGDLGRTCQARGCQEHTTTAVDVNGWRALLCSRHAMDLFAELASHLRGVSAETPDGRCPWCGRQT